MPIAKNSIIFLVRSYNESSRIVSTITGILQNGYSEIVVVDDGSLDNTKDLLVKNFGHKIHYILHPMNRGGGAALETGFEFVRRNASRYGWRYIVTFDADGQHNIGDMEKFLLAFDENPRLDVVFGSRFLIKTQSNVPIFRHIILWGGKIFTALISGIHLTDAHNGYRMLRVSILSKIYLTMDGMEYASELIDQVKAYNFRYKEVPVNIYYDEYTLGKGQRFGGPIRIAARMIWKKFLR